MATPAGDADLLALCVRLRDLQAGWLRLWNATSDAPDGDGSPADQLFERYSAWIWPGAKMADIESLALAVDPVRGLLILRATTPDGLRAKAAAVLALDNANNYSRCERSDLLQIAMSAVRDVAGVVQA